MVTLGGEDFAAILKYPFLDKQWFSKLVLQGALLLFLSFFLVGIPFLAGFTIAITRRTIENKTNLPDWSEWGLFWRDGWKVIAINFVYMIPALVLLFGALLFFGISIGLTEVDNDFAILMVPTGIILFLVYFLVLIYELVIGWLVYPTIVPLIALNAPIKAGLRVKQYVWPYLKSNIGNLLLGLLIGYLVTIIASFGMFFLFIGYLFTMPYAFAVIAHINGLIYRKSPIQYSA